MASKMNSHDDLVSAAEQLIGKVNELRALRVAKQRELNSIEGAALPPAELEAAMRKWLHGQLDQWQSEYGRLVPHAMSERVPHAPGGHSAILISLLLRDVLDDRLSAFVAQLDYIAGPPFAQRAALKARIERELQDVEEEEERLVDRLQSSGLPFEHRDDVKQRRATEASRREQAEREVAQRREREAAIDAKFDEAGRRSRRIVLPNPDAPVRGGRSQYIERGRQKL